MTPSIRGNNRSRGKGSKVKATVVGGVFKSKLLNVQKKLLQTKLQLQIHRTEIVSEEVKKELVTYFNVEHGKKCLVCRTNPCTTKQSHQHNLFHIEDVNLAIKFLGLLPDQIKEIADNKIRANKDKVKERSDRKKTAAATLLRLELETETTRVSNLQHLERADDWINNVFNYIHFIIFVWLSLLKLLCFNIYIFLLLL